MAVYVKLCRPCRRRKLSAAERTDRRNRKTCPDCSWIAVVRSGAQRRSLGTFGTRAEADAAEREALVNASRGIDLAPATVTVDDVLDRFIADRKAIGRAATTIEGYEAHAEHSIRPHLGKVKVAQLKPAHISEWLAKLAEKGHSSGRGLAPKTIAHAFQLLRTALRWAVRKELAARNAAESVDPPSVPHVEGRAITGDQAEAIFSEADKTGWGPFFRVSASVGLRRGEMCALRWRDVDLTEAMITIRHALVKTKAGIQEKPPKNGQIRRRPISTYAVAALRAQLEAQSADKKALGRHYHDSGHVFQLPGGGNLEPDHASEAFRTIRDRLKIDASLHTLRHTFGSLALSAGADLVTVSWALGHSSPAITAKVYAHVIGGTERRAVNAVGRLLRGAKKRSDEAACNPIATRQDQKNRKRA